MSSILRVTPEALIERLYAVQDTISKSYWEIGDIANELFLIVQANGLPFTFVQVCGFVGEYIDRSYGTVMDYALNATFFGKELREKYEALPFSHFQVARSFAGTDDGGNPLWKIALETSMDYSATYGRPPNRGKLYMLLENYRQKSIENYQNETASPYARALNAGSGGTPKSAPGHLPEVSSISVSSRREVDELGAERQREMLDSLYAEVKTTIARLAQIFSKISALEAALGAPSSIQSGLARQIASLRAFCEVIDIVRLAGDGSVVPAGTYVSTSFVYDEVQGGE